MELLVVIDTNILLAACLGTTLDPKAEIAHQVFQDLKELGVKPYIVKSIKEESEHKLREKVGKILDALRNISQEVTSSPPSHGENELDILESLFARLRSETPESVNVLQLIERQVVKTFNDMGPAKTITREKAIVQVTMETSVVSAEIQRRFDTLGTEVLQDPPNIEVGKFQGVVQGKDVNHIACAAAMAKTRGSRIVFVTMDGNLHAARNRITQIEPNLTVTTPPYLRWRIEQTQEESNTAAI